MRKLLLSIGLLTCLFSPCWLFAANVLYVNQEALNKEAARISFSGDSALVQFADSSSMKVDLSVLKIVFTPLNNKEKVSLPTFYLLETAVSDQLSLSGMEASTMVEVMNLQGKICLSQRFDSQEGRMDVSQLPQGVYLLRVNGRVIKFIKK